MKNSNVKTLTIVSGIVVVALIIALTLVFSNGVSGQNVQVSGQSTVKVTPDLVTIYFNVDTHGQYIEVDTLEDYNHALKTW